VSERDDRQHVEAYLRELAQTLLKVDSGTVARAIGWLRQARDEGHTVFVCGNGGSAAIASQLVVDLVKGASLRQPTRFKALCLSDNVPTLTAYANDEGYDRVFVEPLQNFARPGDVLIAVSNSGNSPNVLEAVRYARQLGCRTIALTNSRSGRLREEAELVLEVPTLHPGRLEDAFFVLTHVLAYAFIPQQTVPADRSA